LLEQAFLVLAFEEAVEFGEEHGELLFSLKFSVSREARFTAKAEKELEVIW
jgi:hypothetical protein